MCKVTQHMRAFNLCDCVCASANWVTSGAVNQHKLTEMIIRGNQEARASSKNPADRAPRSPDKFTATLPFFLTALFGHIQGEDPSAGENSILERQTLKPRKAEAVLHLRRVEQSRENETVLSKVGKFLGKNWSDFSKEDEDETTSVSDITDDEEELIIQKARRRHRCDSPIVVHV